MVEQNLLRRYVSVSPSSTGRQIPALGFGWEFSRCLETKFEEESERLRARLERYGRYGAVAEDLLRESTYEIQRKTWQMFILRRRRPLLSLNNRSSHLCRNPHEIIDQKAGSLSASPPRYLQRDNDVTRRTRLELERERE
jgi:hypothetical protein